MIRRSVVLLCCLLALTPIPSAHAARLTILHTNDSHGHLLPFSYPEGMTGSRTLDSLRVRRDIGGIARRATLARTIRETADAQGDAVLLIDAGDFCDGTPFSTEYHGGADLAALRAAGYDFATLGNHEFNNPPEQVRKFVQESQDGAGLRFLSANVLDAGGIPLATPYALIDLDSVRVGLFGLTTEEARTYPAGRAGLQVVSVAPTARGISSALRRMGADVVVLISHCGEDEDKELAASAPALDVIVGGHSHSRLPAGEYFRPFEASPIDSNGTILVQAHQWGGELGRLDLDLERDASSGRWTIVGRKAQLLPITSAIAPDPRVAAVVDSFWAPIAPKYGEVVGQAKDDFSSRRRKDGAWDQANYNLVADAIRETFGTQIELENLGGVRAPLVRGPITLTDLVTMDPFDNTIVTYSLTGRDLKRILLKERPAVSGLTYHIRGGALVEVKVGGKPVQDDEVYTGASNSYFARGALKGIQVTDTKRPRLQVLQEYVSSKSVLTPKYDGRRRIDEE